MDVGTIKKKWKYLKDCYMKDKKKINEYIPSGSAASATRKSSFRFYEAMTFLSDCMETRQTVNTLPKNVLKPLSPISPRSLSPLSPLPSTSYASEFNVSKNRGTASTSPVNAGECSISSSLSMRSSSSSCNIPSSKKRKSSNTGNLDEAFITALMNEPVAENDPIQSFLLSLADGLRQLPYKERTKLQIEFLSRILETHNKLGL